MVGAALVDRSELGATFAFLFIHLFFAVPIYLIMCALVGLPIFIYGGKEKGRWEAWMGKKMHRPKTQALKQIS